MKERIMKKLLLTLVLSLIPAFSYTDDTVTKTEKVDIHKSLKNPSEVCKKFCGFYGWRITHPTVLGCKWTGKSHEGKGGADKSYCECKCTYFKN